MIFLQLYLHFLYKVSGFLIKPKWYTHALEMQWSSLRLLRLQFKPVLGYLILSTKFHYFFPRIKRATEKMD